MWALRVLRRACAPAARLFPGAWRGYRRRPLLPLASGGGWDPRGGGGVGRWGVAAWAVCLGSAVARCDNEGGGGPRAAAEGRNFIADAAETALPAVVQIVMEDARGNTVSGGSGFIISKEGLAVTNLHVVMPAAGLSLEMNKRHFPSTVFRNRISSSSSASTSKAPWKV